MLAQAEGESEVKESQNEDLDAVAEFLAQLGTEETEKLTALVETKSKAAKEEEIELAQIEDFDFEEEDNELAQISDEEWDYDF